MPTDFSYESVGDLGAISIGARSARERFAKAIEKFLIAGVLRLRARTRMYETRSDRNVQTR